MKKTILILSIMALVFASCKRDELLEEGDKWHNGHAAVDLGLPSGLYWATCNIGASSPEEDGFFFAWGEVNPKTVSSEENSETNNKNLGDISGDAQYDAARANWGGYWRMPTKYEMQELVEHCSWEKETQNGIEGYRVTGPSGNSIFMAGSHWTSSPYKDAVYISHPPIYNHNEAYMLDVNGDVFDAHRINLNNVRPVFCKSENPQGFDAISESVSHVTSTTANFYAMVMQDEPSIIKTYGVCWSTNARPTIDDDCDTRYEYLDPMNHGNCSYDTHLENLRPNTKYYVRAFATHGDAVVYGEIMSFMTLPAESGQENGHTYIDLGLPSGVKWSMEIFDNTSWGEDGRLKDTYEAGNCITYGMQLGDISGNDDYDPVHRSWGGAWRMPTEYEMRELVEQCSWELGCHENYGYEWYGYKVTGPNGNSIVIPANGYRGESAYMYEGNEKGYYWTSTPYNDGSNHYAYSLEFDEGNIEVKQNLRYYGYNIIPVIGFNSQIYPTVITEEVTDITCNSAKCEVEIISEGSVDIYAVGAYWSKNPNPNEDDYDGADFDGTASRVVEMSYLEPNTTYYVRAAAHTSLGRIYGEERSFTTLEDVKELPVVTTNEITDIEASSAICVSEVTDDGGGTVLARGVCWSTSQNPTTNDSHTTDGTGTGSFTSNLTNLTANTTYYVRAYATNEKGTSYGKQKSFTTLEEFENETITVNGVSFTMIAVEGGTFKMGAQSSDSGGDNYDSDASSNESPVHDVTLSSYYIGETEVTQELWEAVMGSNPSDYSGSQKPVVNVSWNDCQEFITKLNELTGKNFRLPTEAEWEYAARGGNKSNGYKYSGSNTIGNVAWYYDNSSSETHNVKTKQANELGIYDMSGNVWEWCQDWYGSNYYSNSPSTNPTGPTSGSSRVLRGGSWYNNAGHCRVSYRGIGNPGNTNDGLGLRLSLSQD